MIRHNGEVSMGMSDCRQSAVMIRHNGEVSMGGQTVGGVR